MLARRLSLTLPSRRESLLATAAAGATVLIVLAATRKLGSAGLYAPLLLVLVAILALRPITAVALVVGLTVLCEANFGLVEFPAKLYALGYKDISAVDGLVALAVAAVCVDAIRHGRRLRVPRPLIVPCVILALAMVVGVVVGRNSGTSLRFAVSSEHVLFYLLLLPIAVASLQLDRRQVTLVLGCLFALAAFKSVLGLIEVAGHYGSNVVEAGTETLSYYEPTANWLTMIGSLTVFAALVARAKLPVWVLLGSPLLVACLILSYRRSFWIGAVLGLALVLLLGTSPVGRRLLVPGALGLAIAVWLLGSIHFQDQVPLVKRVASLNPSKLEASAEDRYRNNERANVIAEIKAHPITGLGVGVPWQATAQTLSVEYEAEGRQYVHFAVLWFWLKLGILGLLAYVGMMIGSMWIAFQAWRRSSEPLLRAFGLASLCGMVGLVAIDSTASFTGVEPRFTILFATQVGLLAIIARTAAPAPAPQAIGPAGPWPVATGPAAS
jgi:O-antigen ligase